MKIYCPNCKNECNGLIKTPGNSAVELLLWLFFLLPGLIYSCWRVNEKYLICSICKYPYVIPKPEPKIEKPKEEEKKSILIPITIIIGILIILIVVAKLILKI